MLVDTGAAFLIVDKSMVAHGSKILGVPLPPISVSVTNTTLPQRYNRWSVWYIFLCLPCVKIRDALPSKKEDILFFSKSAL